VVAQTELTVRASETGDTDLPWNRLCYRDPSLWPAELLAAALPAGPCSGRGHGGGQLGCAMAV